MAQPQDKQTQLIASMHGAFAGDFKKLTDMLSALTVTTNSVLARLEVLEAATAGGAPAAKRAVRTAAAKGGAKAAAEDPLDKITNTLLYFRYKMATDAAFRETHAPEEVLAEVADSKTVTSKDITKSPGDYWSAVGGAIWKDVLSEDQKTGLRTEYTTWKDERKRQDAEPPLDEEELE